MKETPVIQVEDLSFSFGGPLVLEHVSIDVDPREFLGLVGPNGGGKSTLLKVMLGLLTPTAGRVQILGKRPGVGRRHVGYVPQYPAFPRDFPVTVTETVLLGRLGKTRLVGGFGKADREAAREAMARAEVLELKDRPIATLSGGQLQRVLIARALASEPRILMLDEPTANIDQRVETDIFDLLRQLRERMAIIVVSHDIGFVSQYVTRVACLNRTLMCHQTEALTGETIEALYRAPVRMVHHVH